MEGNFSALSSLHQFMNTAGCVYNLMFKELYMQRPLLFIVQ